MEAGAAPFPECFQSALPALSRTHAHRRNPRSLQKAKNGDWQLYERQFLDLMRARHIERTTPREIPYGGCLLCSEEKPHHCHRRLVAEYLKEHWSDVEIEHIP
jgi:hypothetical protein